MPGMMMSVTTRLTGSPETTSTADWPVSGLNDLVTGMLKIQA